MLYMNIIGSDNTPLKNYVVRVCDGQILGLGVLHDIITSISSTNGLGFEGWTPIYEPRNSAIKYILPNLKQFCFNFYQKSCLNTEKLFVVEILLAIINVIDLPKDIDLFCQCAPLEQMTNDFFGRYE